MINCCLNCKNLDSHHKCKVLEEQFVVMVRVFDRDFADISARVNKVQAVTLKDIAVKEFCCNNYEKSQGGKKNDY